MADDKNKNPKAGTTTPAATPVATPAAPAAVTPAVTVPAAPKTEAELMAEMKSAMASGDFKAVSKVASELVKFQRTKEEAELKAKQDKLAAISLTVKAAIEKALQPFIANGTLDLADGVWYTQDFGEKSSGLRLMKAQVKASGTGTHAGGGKKFSTSTEELMAKYGEQDYKGQTFKAAWESNTDKNWRYGIREALLKLNGDIK